MPETVDHLPSWIAHALARAAPVEEPDDEALRGPLRAWAEWVVVRVLSEVLATPEQVPFTIESAMRLSMLEVMDAEAWIDLLASLEHAGLLPVAGVPDPLPDAVRATCARAGVGSLLELLERAAGDAPPPAGAVEAIAALSSPALIPWVVRAGADGALKARCLAGTRYAPLVEVDWAGPPPPPGLVFRDGERVVRVPPWLATWDESARVLRVYDGRDPRTGRWRYRTRMPPGDTQERDHAPEGIPPFLAEPTWNTPTTEPRPDQNAQTGAFHRGDALRATVQMASGRVAAPEAPVSEPERPAVPAPPGARLVLRVVAGPDLLRYVPVNPAAPVVIGRNPGQATFVVHHHQVSRTHTRVRATQSGEVYVQDLGSTNGTQVRSRILTGADELRLYPGDVIGSGPVSMRLEWITPPEEERLRRIATLRDDETRRDPLTLLLKPTHLIDELPAELRPGFREGGESAAPIRLWGALLYLDRLAAIHAQHGERIADRTFRDVARVLQYAVHEPERWVRVGYGELLLPLIGVDEAAARAEAERLLQLVADHPWEWPLEKLSATASVSGKRGDEPATDWLKRLRRQLQDGRTRQGRGRVYP